MLECGRRSHTSNSFDRYHFNRCLSNKFRGYKQKTSKNAFCLTVDKQSTPEICFTANTQRGTPTAILAGLGTSQIAKTSLQPLELLSVSVRDAWYNQLPNIPVIFTIKEGDASFADLPGAPACVNPNAGLNGVEHAKPTQRLIVTTGRFIQAATVASYCHIITRIHYQNNSCLSRSNLHKTLVRTQKRVWAHVRHA